MAATPSPRVGPALALRLPSSSHRSLRSLVLRQSRQRSAGPTSSGHALALSGRRFRVSGHALALSGRRFRASGPALALSGHGFGVSGHALALSGRRFRVSGRVPGGAISRYARSTEVCARSTLFCARSTEVCARSGQRTIDRNGPADVNGGDTSTGPPVGRSGGEPALTTVQARPRLRALSYLLSGDTERATREHTRRGCRHSRRSSSPRRARRPNRWPGGNPGVRCSRTSRGMPSRQR